MSDERQHDSDPLPFTQVDRTAKALAMRLAPALGSTTQHALGSLVEFWDLNGDPRRIERLHSDGKREVLLSGAEVRELFEVASGHSIEPRKLAVVGVLEDRGGDVFRVRGMSRFFDAIERRVHARNAGSAGGKASAEARKARNGTAQPRSGGASGVAQPPAEADIEAPPKQFRSTTEAPAQALPKQPRSAPEQEDRGQRTPLLPFPSETGPAVKMGTSPQKPEPPPSESKLRGDPRHAALVQGLCEAYEMVRHARYPFKPRDAKAVTELLATGENDVALKAAWRKALRQKTYPTVSTLPELVTHLAHFLEPVTRVPEAPPPKAPESPAEKLWARVLERIEQDGKQYALTWLSRVAAREVTDGVLVVASGDRFFADWLREHYAQMVGETLVELGVAFGGKRVYGFRIDVAPAVPTTTQASGAA